MPAPVTPAQAGAILESVAGIVAVIGVAAIMIGLPFWLSWHDSRPAVRARLYYTPLDGPPVLRSQLRADPRPAPPAPGPGCGALVFVIGSMGLAGFVVFGAIGGLLGLIVGVWAAFVVGGIITHTVDS